MCTKEVTTIDQLNATLDFAKANELRCALVEIAEALSFDEHGRYEPEESVAASSAADFIESVKYTFRKVLGIEL